MPMMGWDNRVLNMPVERYYFCFKRFKEDGAIDVDLTGGRLPGIAKSAIASTRRLTPSGTQQESSETY